MVRCQRDLAVLGMPGCTQWVSTINTDLLLAVGGIASRDIVSLTFRFWSECTPTSKQQPSPRMCRLAISASSSAMRLA